MENIIAAGINNFVSPGAKNACGKATRFRSVVQTAALLVLIAVVAMPGYSQSNSDLRIYFQQDIGLSKDQIAAIQSGQPVTKTYLPARGRRSSCLARSSSMLLLRATSNLPAISIDFASFPIIWRSEYSVILHSFRT
jgi:hypothetical protein